MTAKERDVPKSPLHVATTNSLLADGCDVYGRAAAPATVVLKNIYSKLDIRDEIVAAGGGAWFEAFTTLFVSIDPGRSATITSVALRREAIPPPAWGYEDVRLYGPPVCGGGQPALPTGPPMPTWDTAGVSVDPDTGTITPGTDTDGGRALSRHRWRLSTGLRFVTLNTGPIVACHGNYRLSFVITYRIPGYDKVLHLTTKPILIYGLARDTRFFGGYQDNEGEIHGKSLVRTGSDPGCSGPGIHTMAPLDWGRAPWPPSSPAASSPPPDSSPTPTITPTPTTTDSPGPTPTDTPSP